MLRHGSPARILLIASLAIGLVHPPAALAVVPASSTRLEAVSIASGDAQKGYIAGGFAPDIGVVARTTDGGANWRATLSSHWLHAVNASSDGSSVMASNSQPAFDWVESSINSGLDWAVQQPAGNSITAGYGGLAHLSGDRRVGVGVRSDFGSIYHSVSGGLWSKKYEGPVYPASGDNPPPTTHAYLTAIDAGPDDSVAWAVGNDWTLGSNKVLVFKTVNGGANWSPQTSYTSSSLWVTCVTAASADVAYIGRRTNYLLRTLNGGTNWGVAPTAIVNVPYINAIDSVDANKLVVVGDSGRVSFSTNAAATTPLWTARNPAGVTAHLRGVQMLDADSWIVVGDNETILRTDDAGVSWTGSKALGVPAVAIASPTAGFALGSTTINISGTSSDPARDASQQIVAGRSGIGVAKVEVSLQRKIDSKYWNGSAWTVTQTWLAATQTNPANGWDAWTASATLDSIAGLGDGLIVRSRSRDGMGQYSTSARVDSAQPAPNDAPVLSPIGNRTVLVGNPLSIVVSATDGDVGDTLTYSAEPLPAGATFDPGTRTFEFTPTLAQAGALPPVVFVVSDGKSSDSEAVTITVKAPTAMALASRSIVTGYGAKATVKGTLKAGGQPVELGRTVVLKRGSTVVKTALTKIDGSFSFEFTPRNVATPYTVSYGGDTGYLGSWSTVKITPKAKLTTPKTPKSVKRSRYFKAYTYLYPKHATGATGTTFYFYRYQKKSNGTYGYVLKKTVRAKATNSSTYPGMSKATVRLKLKSPGKWRVQVRHADAGHYPTLSWSRYFKVRK